MSSRTAKDQTQVHAAEIVREYGPFAGADRIHGVTHDGHRVWAATGDKLVASKSQHVIEVPPAADLLAPLITVIPLQLLAYHIAVRRGCDVDQPRNLAKSVTVE